MPESKFSNNLTEHPIRAGKRTDIIRWLGTILALVLLVYLLSREGWEDILQALSQISIWRFVLCFFLMLLSRLAVAGRWHILLHSAEINIKSMQTIQVTFAGLFASNFLPTTIGGDVIRLGGIIQLGFDKTISITSLIVDRLVGMAGMASALPFGTPVLIKFLRVSDPVALYPLPFFLTSFSQSDGWWVRILNKIRYAFQQLLSSLSIWLKQPKSLSVAFLYTWLHQLSLYAQMWLLLKSLGESLPLWSIAGLWAATYFVTLLPVSVNGLGMQEISATFFFTSVGGISLENSLTLAMLIRVLQTFASLPGALFIPKMLSGEARQN